jgi:hypothetical protein
MLPLDAFTNVSSNAHTKLGTSLEALCSLKGRGVQGVRVQETDLGPFGHVVSSRRLVVPTVSQAELRR